MQFFKEYSQNISTNCGKLECIENTFYVNNIEVINNRGITGDNVTVFNNEVINIHKRNIHPIIGILYLDSKIKYGHIKNKALFLFNPTNKKYPKFYVPYKNDKINKIYVVINFKLWKTQDKLPLGELIEVLGDIGDEDVEIEHLRFYYEIKNNSWKINNKKISEDTLLIDNLQNKKENYNVFSIDPKGSKDIDDAFHFTNLNNSYEVGIHIACPAKFLENDLEIIMQRVSTIYTPNKNYNLLPKIYSENLASLLEGQKRYAISLILNIKDNNIISYDIKDSIVKNIKNYNYDEFDNLYKKDLNLCDFFEFSQKFFMLNEFDSHKLVECWMITANKMIAKYLIDKKINNLILRVHNSSLNQTNQMNLDQCLLKYINIKNEKSAFYELYDNEQIQLHSKLDNDFYTHFTSPIRRAIDFFIHMLIIKENIIFEKEILQKIIDNINKFVKNSRKFDRSVKRLNFLYNIKINDENIITYGYIIKIENYKIYVYIPDYNLEEKIIIIPKKFQNIANIELIMDENDENNNIKQISYVIDNQTKKYTLYERINIKLWVFITFENIFDKLKLQILE